MENKRKHGPEERIERDLKSRKPNGYCREQKNLDSANLAEINTDTTQIIQPFKATETYRKVFQISKLIRDLDDVVNEGSKGCTSELLGKEALDHCLALQACLHKSKARLFPETSKDVKDSQGKFDELASLPKIVSPLTLSPWESSSIPTEYPPLPKILDPTLETATFIHCSASAGHKGALNYEQLELIGDAYMELIATLLISQTFPSLSPGKQSQIREMLVKNITLANYSLQYKFDKRLKMDWALLQSASLTKVKVLGDVFEAYVAAVVLSDPENGVMKVSQWLKQLWSMTIATTIIEEETSDRRVSSHLWHLRGNLSPEKVAEAFNDRPIHLNSKEKLQKLIGGKYAKLSYRELTPPVKDPTTKLAVFSMGVFLDGWGEKNKLLGSGKANGKKEAGLKAATKALENKNLIQTYADQKIATQGQEAKNGKV